MATAMNGEHLRTYLNDPLAGAGAEIQLAKDCLAHGPAGPIGRELSVIFNG